MGRERPECRIPARIQRWRGVDRLGTPGGKIYRGDQLHAYSRLDQRGFLCHVTSLLEDSHGRIWLGTAKRGLYRWEAGTLARLTNATLDQRIIFTMAEDHEGQIWLGTEQGLICCNSNLEVKPVAPLITEIRALLVDRQGVLWIGTSGNGLVRRHHNRNEGFQRKDGFGGRFCDRPGGRPGRQHLGWNPGWFEPVYGRKVSHLFHDRGDCRQGSSFREHLPEGWGVGDDGNGSHLF